ncbi:MAG: hypothetical protein MRJ68_00610 [Nitrospira sp.]|nr:hypothetical protein [Nitrospira sp.]
MVILLGHCGHHCNLLPFGLPTLDPPTGTKEVIIAKLTHASWRDAHPATNRFVILQDFNNEAVLGTNRLIGDRPDYHRYRTKHVLHV